MKRLLVFSPKGGSGKSTVARNLAVGALLTGLRVGTLDTDPQATLTEWWNRRPAAVPPIDHYQTPLYELFEIEDVEGLDVLVIDTPTAAEAYKESADKLIRRANLVLMPCQPTPEDVISLRRSMEYVRSIQRNAAFVLNRAFPKLRETLDTRRQLAGVADMAPVDIPNLAEVYRSFTAGLGVQEMARTKSADDFKALWSFAADRLGILK